MFVNIRESSFTNQCLRDCLKEYTIPLLVWIISQCFPRTILIFSSWINSFSEFLWSTMIFISQWFLVSIFPTKRWGGGAELRFERSFPDVSGSGPYQWVADQGKGRFPRVPWPPWHPATEMWKAPVLRWKHGTYGTRTGKQWCRYGKPTGFQGTWSTNGV